MVLQCQTVQHLGREQRLWVTAVDIHPELDECPVECYTPIPDASFHLVFCVNALHHFDQPRSFITEARRLLAPGGTLVIIGMDPHAGRDEWYVYQYFYG